MVIVVLCRVHQLGFRGHWLSSNEQSSFCIFDPVLLARSAQHNQHVKMSEPPLLGRSRLALQTSCSTPFGLGERRFGRKKFGFRLHVLYVHTYEKFMIGLWHLFPVIRFVQISTSPTTSRTNARKF
jgi:hypothetical protein